MSKIGLVITQEYKSRVAKKSFLVLTLLMPLLFVALIFTPIWLATLKDGEMKLVAVVDQTGKYESVFTDNDAYNFELIGEPIDVLDAAQVVDDVAGVRAAQQRGQVLHADHQPPQVEVLHRAAHLAQQRGVGEPLDQSIDGHDQ